MTHSDQAHTAPGESVKLTEAPPTTMVGILARLGPGMIMAASIVGSGELIATTKTGAEAGFTLLWLILLGCVVKVFVQIEFGRYSLVTGKSTMTGLAEVPGPRIRGRGNWIVWYWFLMWFASIGQLGGIIGGVGQAMAISLPLTPAGQTYNEYHDLATFIKVHQAERRLIQSRTVRNAAEEARDAALASDLAESEQLLASLSVPAIPYDARIWAVLIAVATSVVLVVGHYGLIQHFSTFLVCGFTVVSMVNVAMLQRLPSWAVTLDELLGGLSLGFPEGSGTATALATFGIIGVGASELVTYPYWCLEKGYARFTGPRDASVEWAERANGWMRVMRWDAWFSMVIYTFATLAFYMLGAAILGRTQLNPEKNEMIRTLAVMYVPVFNEAASLLFLFGAFAVLYSTYFVANASHARVFSDTLGVIGFSSPDEQSHRRRIRILSGFFPLLCVAIYLCFPSEPAALVLIGGVMQGIMLPMLAGAALFFRYRRGDTRIQPGRIWDAFLWLSGVAMLITGLWTLWDKLKPLIGG